MDLFIDFYGSVLKDIKGLLYLNWSGENAGGKRTFFGLITGCQGILKVFVYFITSRHSAQ